MCKPRTPFRPQQALLDPITRQDPEVTSATEAKEEAENLEQDAADSDPQTLNRKLHFVSWQQGRSRAMASDLDEDSGERVSAMVITTPIAQVPLYKEQRLHFSQMVSGDVQSFDSELGKNQLSELATLNPVSELRNHLHDLEKRLSSPDKENLQEILEKIKGIKAKFRYIQGTPKEIPQRRVGLPGEIQICRAIPVTSPVAVSTSNGGPSSQYASIRSCIHGGDKYQQVTMSTSGNGPSSQCKRVSRDGQSVRTPQAGVVKATRIVASNSIDLYRIGEEGGGNVIQLAGRMNDATLRNLSARYMRKIDDGADDGKQSNTLFFASGAILSRRAGGNGIRPFGALGQEAHPHNEFAGHKFDEEYGPGRKLGGKGSGTDKPFQPDCEEITTSIYKPVV
ncbi:hypothetical protein GGI35DRAFT_463573 [Trichoderma velutinum]